MELVTTERVSADVLVIGGGGAGLRAAIAARKHGANVVLISESPAGFRNNTAISKATLAVTGVWKEPGDSLEVHLKDTMAAGRFINDRRLVAAMTHGVREQVYHLIEFGVNFRQRDGELLVAAVRDRSARAEGLPKHQIVDIPGNKPLYPRPVSLTVSISNQGFQIRAVTLGVARQSQFPSNGWLSLTVKENQVMPLGRFVWPGARELLFYTAKR